MTETIAIAGARIFDGSDWHENQSLLFAAGKVTGFSPIADNGGSGTTVQADGLLVVPGFVDLQVNGGGGVLFNNMPSEDGIRRICATHARYGTTALLPTLITDSLEITARAIEAGTQAHRNGIPGYLGLHLEGPYLSTERKGTHDPALIRPMTETDLQNLINLAGTFGKALITLAPESVTEDQVRHLSAAGYCVSLGHSNADCPTALRYVQAGASMVTHLFNAMSPLTHREPGMVGAALSSGALSCGLIADGFHVDPVAMGIALRAKTGPAHIFLVTDAMSTIGTDDTGLELNGRQIFRQGGRLTLADGTLAGADIDMLSCIRYVHKKLGLPLDEALRMASTYPARAIGAHSKGRLEVGLAADFVLLTPDLELVSTWIDGQCVYQA
ncbi:MAG: N-acetylglucosamine-6-phosphate deacetylase [Allorhizobium sp.]